LVGAGGPLLVGLGQWGVPAGLPRGGRQRPAPAARAGRAARAFRGLLPVQGTPRPRPRAQPPPGPDPGPPARPAAVAGGTRLIHVPGEVVRKASGATSARRYVEAPGTSTHPRADAAPLAEP